MTVISRPQTPNGDKSGIRVDIHFIKCIDKDNGMINATDLQKKLVGDETNFKSLQGFRAIKEKKLPQIRQSNGDLGVVVRAYEGMKKSVILLIER